MGDSPYRDASGDLTADAAQGQLVFQSRGCVACHHGEGFTDSPLAQLHDIGTIKPSSGQRLGGPLAGLDTSSLRGLWSTAPYLHDGSAATLRQAVTAHQNLSLNALELDHLSAFLHQIDDREPAPTASACGDLEQEAETGQLSGAFAIGSDGNASGGQYVHVPNGTGNSPANSANHVTYCFTVTTPGIYYLKGWTYADNGFDDSFFVQVDGFPASGYLWDVLQNTGYAMDYVSDRHGANPVELTLAAGEHQITVYQREDGTRLDRLALELVDDQLPPTAYGLVLGHSGNGSVTANPAQATYASGTTVQLTASADAGWHFVGWTGDVEASTNPLTVMMDRDLSVIAVFAETTQTGCGGLVQEAEAGERFGAFVIGNDTAASGGQYIHVPNGTGGGYAGSDHYARFCFLVLTPGRYRLQGHVYGATGFDDSFFVRIDDEPIGAYLWDFPKNTVYAPDNVSDRNGADPVEVVLTAGEHTVVVHHREDGARLDKLTLTFVEAVAGLTGSGTSNNLVVTQQIPSSGQSVDGSQPGLKGSTLSPTISDGSNETISRASALWVHFVEASATRLSLSESADSQAKRLAVGDFNRDGWDDVIVVRRTPFGGSDAHQDMLLLNENGVLHDRTALHAAGFLSHPTPASDVLVADIDGDDWSDVVIVTTGGHVPVIYRNLGLNVDGQWLGLEHEQTWLPVMESDNAHFCAAAAGDLNADGAVDLYLVNCKANLLGRDVLLINNGNGYLSEESQMRLGPLRQSALGTAVQLVDVDGDIDLDVVKLSLGKAIPPWQQTGAFVLFNDGRGYFATWQNLAGSTTSHIGNGDLDGDGQSDLYIVDQGTDQVLFVAPSIADTQVDVLSQVIVSRRTAGSGGRVQFADLDRDGDLDVGIADVDLALPPCETGSAASRKFTLLQNDGTGRLRDPWAEGQLLWSQNAYDAAFLDVNRDGKMDMLLGTCDGYAVYINTPMIAE